MKNCIILGFGRSGTSLMGGILFQSGYFMGHDLYPPRESNPKGFFENEFINTINETILSEYDYIKTGKTDRPVDHPSSPFNPIYGQRWLSYIAPCTSIENKDGKISEDIKLALAEPVFAYKDPRFNYTLPVWFKYFSSEPVCICVFRQPEIVAESVLRDSNSRYLPGQFYITPEIVFELWENSYKRLLLNLQELKIKKVVFVHYEQLLTREAIPRLSNVLGTKLDEQFISPELNRCTSDIKSPESVRLVYNKLCKLAGFKNEKSSYWQVIFNNLPVLRRLIIQK